MMNLKTFIFIVVMFSIFNANAEQLKLKSDPVDAIVYVRDLNSAQNIKVGTTPYEGSINDLATNFAKSNFFLIIIEKAGYESQSILMSDLLKSDIELSINLIPKEDVLHFRNLDRAITNLFESQRLMRAGQYDEAMNVLKSVEQEQPKLSIVPEFMGSAYYLKKDLRGSLSMYEKAYRMNPENKDAYTMKVYLRKSLGSDDEKK